MRVFAIGDLHFSLGSDKPMDVFGPKWHNQYQRICQAWEQTVGDEDLVLVPGDISWSMQLDQAKPDIEAVGKLPGRKILLRGNHDFWWSSLSKVRSILPGNMDALQNQCIFLPGLAIVGTRGWVLPGENTSPEDRKIYLREVERLILSLKDMEKHGSEGRLLLGMMHYPPLLDQPVATDFTRLFTQYGITRVCYGHLHNLAPGRAFEGVFEGVEYVHVSCDYLDFKPRLLAEI